MDEPTTFWHGLLHGPDSDQVLQAAMAHVAAGVSKMTGRPITSDPPQLKQMALAEVPACLGDPEAAAVGIYLQIAGGLVGWALLSLPLELAQRLAGWVTEEPAGSGSRLGRAQRSVLAEVGNLALSYFLNAIADHAGATEPLLPSPPAVVVDMLGAILDLIITPAAAADSEFVIIETSFRDSDLSVQACFWVAPDLAGAAQDTKRL